MIISATHRETFDASAVRLTGNATDAGDQVAVGDVYLYMTAAEMSELGHRFIELAAQAEEHLHGPAQVA